MSTNLVYNGNFSLPAFTTNTINEYPTFTTQEVTDLYWTAGGPYVRITNGVPTPNFINPSLIGFSQACFLLNNSSISQSFTVPFADSSYILSLYYSVRAGYTFSNTQIIINGVLFDTLSTPTNWTRYINTVPSSNLNVGVNTIQFLGVGVSGTNYAVVITGISFVYGQFGGAQPAPGVGITASYNNLKTTTINGSLTVLDWIPTGKSLIQGTISTQRHYNYNYATLPTFYSSSLGCVFQSNVASTTVTANSFTASPALSIPIGVYIVDGFCIFTPTTASAHILKLGINTISGSFTSALTSYNNTVENTLTASNLPHSIRYHNILTVATATTFYFIFNTNIAGNLNGTFNGKFIRIG